MIITVEKSFVIKFDSTIQPAVIVKLIEADAKDLVRKLQETLKVEEVKK